MKKAIALFISAGMLLSPVSASALSAEQAEGYAEGIVSFEKNKNHISDSDSLLSGDIAERAGNDNADWLAIGAVRAGLEDRTGEYYTHWKKNINDKYTHDGGLDRDKATEWHRAVLTAQCLGADPANLSGIDLLNDGVYSRGDDKPLGKQGLNGWVWALIAVDSCDWKFPDNAKVTRLDLINTILYSQNADGGFSIAPTDGRSDPDITAMALQALAPYRGCQEAKEVTTAAVDYLALKQSDFDSCETVSQVICALCCLGIDPDEDARFSTLTDELISYANDDGGFAHTKDGLSNEMASAQALIAFCSIERLRSGERQVYDMNAGMAEPVTETVLITAANRKERNTTLPNTDELRPWSVKHYDKETKIAIVAMILAIGVVTVAAGIFLRNRKERSK